jgi:hypothetical protein
MYLGVMIRVQSVTARKGTPSMQPNTWYHGLPPLPAAAASPVLLVILLAVLAAAASGAVLYLRRTGI